MAPATPTPPPPNDEGEGVDKLRSRALFALKLRDQAKAEIAQGKSRIASGESLVALGEARLVTAEMLLEELTRVSSEPKNDKQQKSTPEVATAAPTDKPEAPEVLVEEEPGDGPLACTINPRWWERV